MSPLCVARPHLDLHTHLVWSTKNVSIPSVGSSLALRVSSYGDKWLPRPACSHHFAQKHAELALSEHYLDQAVVAPLLKTCEYQSFQWKAYT